MRSEKAPKSSHKAVSSIPPSVDLNHSRSWPPTLPPIKIIKEITICLTSKQSNWNNISLPVPICTYVQRFQPISTQLNSIQLNSGKQTTITAFCTTHEHHIKQFHYNFFSKIPDVNIPQHNRIEHNTAQPPFPCLRCRIWTSAVHKCL